VALSNAALALAASVGSAVDTLLVTRMPGTVNTELASEALATDKFPRSKK